MWSNNMCGLVTTVSLLFVAFQFSNFFSVAYPSFKIFIVGTDGCFVVILLPFFPSIEDSCH